jgi:hypothetical protein
MSKWLLSLLLLCGSPTELFGAMTAGSMAVIANCDLPLPTFKKLKAGSAEQCADFCKNNEQCNSFVFISGWRQCQLKNKKTRPRKIQMNSAYQGSDQLKQTLDDVRMNHDIKGADLKRVAPVKTLEQCMKACSEHSKCVAITYVDGYDVCWLKENFKSWQPKIFSCGIKEEQRK